MKNRRAVSLLVLLLLTAFASAETLDQPRDLEPGDRIVYKFTVDNETEIMEETWTALAPRDTIGVANSATREIELVMSRSPDYQIRRGYCPASWYSCSYFPSLDFATFPLETGKKWSTAFTIIGETFKSDVTEERVIERTETIKVPAGVFETYKIKASGRVTSTNMKGQMQYGREESTTWVALVSGKLIVVRATFGNSSGKTSSRELISSSLK